MSVFLRQGSPNYYCEFQIQGRRFLRSTGRTVEREARTEERRIKAEIKAELEKEASRHTEALTLSQAFGRYWQTEAHKLALTWRNEVKRYGTHILTIVDGSMPIADLSDGDVDAFVQAHLSSNGGKYALNRALAVWRRVHNLARRRWKQKTQEIDWAEFLNAEAKRTTHIEPHEAARLMEVAPQQLAQAIEWSLLTGCRWSETYGLPWDKIDLSASRAIVIAKGGREHTIWLTADALDLLTRIPRHGRYVFDRRNWRKAWEASRTRAGLPKLRWHDLRHTHATWLRRAGVPLEIVQRSLGHAELATTTRYAHVADNELQEALQKLPSLATVTPSIVSIRSRKSKV